MARRRLGPRGLDHGCGAPPPPAPSTARRRLVGAGQPRVTWLTAAGPGFDDGDWHDPAEPTLQMALAAPEAGDAAAVLLLAPAGAVRFTLPAGTWWIALDASIAHRGAAQPTSVADDRGGWPWLRGAARPPLSGLRPRRSRPSTAGSVARSRAVRPSSVATAGSTPPAQQQLHHDQVVAVRRRVDGPDPTFLGRLDVCARSRSRWAMTQWPPAAALCSGRRPVPLVARCSGSAPRARSSSATLSWPKTRPPGAGR